MIGIRVVNVSTTELQLEWRNTDSASGYTYHLVLESKNGSVRTNSSQKWITVGDLTPGTLYNVTIFPEVDQIQGDSNSITQYTRESCGGQGRQRG